MFTGKLPHFAMGKRRKCRFQDRHLREGVPPFVNRETNGTGAMSKFGTAVSVKACLVVAAGFWAVSANAQNQTESMNAPARHNLTTMQSKRKEFALAIHGGAGTIERSKVTPEREGEYRAGLERALGAGYEILKGGGSSLDATEAAVRVLEDDPHFNAGKGAVFTNAGTNELDAAIMDGKTLKAGAVANLRHIKNPILLARMLMEKSPHVLMTGEGAETFAKENGVQLVDPKYFFTQERWDALQKIKAAEKSGAAGEKRFIITDQDRHGTVGAVALDKSGNLAAATSTGGTTNKRAGRVGDSPIIGGGTYANNTTCAVSATGDGEYFIRAVVGHDISALMEYRGMKLQEAAQTVLDKVAKLGGAGGLIAVDREGNITLPFNSEGMYRGYVDPNDKFVVEIYR
jgi:beta-aspartyl-peptidase (threonine type)